VGFLGTWLDGVRIGADRRTISTPEALRDFLSAQASFVAQKVVTEYCQAKAGRQWTLLSSEQTFIDDLTRSRWEAFAILLGAMFVLAESQIRAAAALSDEAAGGLVGLYAVALDAYPRPPHRVGGWDDRVEGFATRLAQARSVPPATARAIAEAGGRAVFDVLPIHLNMRRLDGPMVVNAIAFQFAAVAGRMRRRLDVPALAAVLAGAPGAPAQGAGDWAGRASPS
jgi:hypothetical protein